MTGKRPRVRPVARIYTGRSPIEAVTTPGAGRALGMREVTIHCVDDTKGMVLVAHTTGLRAEAEADAALVDHVQRAHAAFERWVQLRIVLEDGSVREFQHLVERNRTNGTVRQAALLHAAWRLTDDAVDQATRADHLRAAQHLAGKPVTVLQPSERERLAHINRLRLPRDARLPFGLRISSRIHSDSLVVVIDLDARLLSRHPRGAP